MRAGRPELRCRARSNPDQDLVQLTIYAGDVKWLEPVQDKDYRAPLGK